MKIFQTFCLSLLALLVFSSSARAEDYVITLKDHQFSPPALDIPAGQKIKLIVKNLGSDKAEFESGDFDVEQTVKPGAQITLAIGPLDPGTYSYFDDLHQQSTGTLTAK